MFDIDYGNLQVITWKGEGRAWMEVDELRDILDVRIDMYLPSATLKQSDINSAVSDVVRSLSPDVVHIRYDIGRDWSGDWGIFFRILLSDEASDKRLREVTTEVVRLLSERLDFSSMGLFPYHNFRNLSEQAVLNDEAWA